MMYESETAPRPGGRKAGLAAKFLVVFVLASAVVLLTGIAGWQVLRTTHREVKTMQQAANGTGAAAMADRILLRIDEAGWELGAGVFIAIALLAGLYLYLVRTVVRPLRTGARLMNRLAIGDGGGDVTALQTGRNDEIGDLARAIRDLTAYQREEVGIADTMSAGDFTRAVTVRSPADALGLAIRRMAGVTVETLGRVNAHVGQVMAGCQAIAEASGDLSANSAGIAAAASEISNKITQIKTRADDNAGMAGEASRLANSGGQYIDRGYKDVGEMGVVMLNMQACGDKIVGIAKSIGDIAFQTNLLALNANVEAARAGRHGKGFTIVAEEVRRLSARTSKAAEETSTLMKETVEQVELAAAIAGRINATFAEMQASVREADALLAKIAAASNEQSGGIDQISDALRRVDRSVRENVEHAGHILKKADGLVGQTGTLRRVMGRFGLDSEPTPDSESFAEPDAALPAVLPRRALGSAGWEP